MEITIKDTAGNIFLQAAGEVYPEVRADIIKQYQDYAALEAIEMLSDDNGYVSDKTLFRMEIEAIDKLDLHGVICDCLDVGFTIEIK